MQAGKNAAASVKESAANMAASAKAGMDKTKATVEEKGERMTTHDPLQKDMATEKKEERKNQAELNKEEAREHHAAARQAAAAPGTGGSTAGPGLGTDQVTEGVVESHPIGTATGTGRTTTAHNTRVGGGTTTGHGTGGGYSG